MSAEVKQNNKEARASERSQKMAYKKPEIVAKSEAKQTFVAGCPSNNTVPGCRSSNAGCQRGLLK